MKQRRAQRGASPLRRLRLVVGLTILSSPAPLFSQPDAPAAPLVLTGSNATSLKASWIAPTGTVTSYDVRYRDAASAPSDPWEMIEDETGTSVTVTNLTQNTAYSVGVRATSASGDSTWSPNGRGYTNAAALVANSGQTSADDESVDSSTRLATSFTTGEGTWALAYVELEMKQWPEGSGLWIQVMSSDDTGEPHVTLISGLGHPPRSTGTVTFTQTYSLELAGETTYYISVLIYGTTNVYKLGVTAADGEDDGAADGWSIGNKGRQYDAGVWSEVESTLKMSIRAIPKVPLVVNNVPVFTSTNPILSVAENTAAGEDVGDAVSVTDADPSDTLAYTLGGADATSFAIVSSSGQIQTKAALDHETDSLYYVNVSVSDGIDSRSIFVEINVSDVAEPPSAPAAPTIDNTTGAATTLRVDWAAPANSGPEITGFALQYKKTMDSAFTAFNDAIDVAFNDALDVSAGSATLTGLDLDTSYDGVFRLLCGHGAAREAADRP